MGNLGACSVACVSGAEGGGEEREKGGKGALPSLPNSRLGAYSNKYGYLLGMKRMMG